MATGNFAIIVHASLGDGLLERLRLARVALLRAAMPPGIRHLAEEWDERGTWVEVRQ